MRLIPNAFANVTGLTFASRSRWRTASAAFMAGDCIARLPVNLNGINTLQKDHFVLDSSLQKAHNTGVARKYKTLADYLEQTGKTQDSLAERLGVSVSYVCLLVSGRRQPSLPLAIRIEAATGVPVEALVSRAVA